MFKCIHGLAPHYLSNDVTMVVDIHGYDTRSSENMNLYVPRCTKELCKRSFLYTGSMLWNDLPMSWKNPVHLMYLKATIVSSLVDNLWDYMGKFICRCTLFNYLHIPGFFYLLSGFLYKGYFVSCFRIIYPIFYGMTFMLCWYVICLFILCGIILCFRQGSKVEQFHWLVIPCINIFEIKNK